MLILSQDRLEIVNFNNITNMFILNYSIKCMLTDGGETYIGAYETEKRAKEVLQEIIKLYKAHPYTVFNAENGEYKQIGNNVVYEMPEK